MINYKVISVCFLSTLSLVGCAFEQGNNKIADVQNHQLIAQKLIPNQTTQDDVRRLFGDPKDIDFMENGCENGLINIYVGK